MYFYLLFSYLVQDLLVWIVKKKSEKIIIIIEDEFHVLVSCPRFVNERNNLLPQSLLENPNIDVFERVFDTSYVHVQTQLALLCLNVERAYLNFV